MVKLLIPKTNLKKTYALQACIPAGSYPLKTLSIISEYLYGNRGFKGNSEDYYNLDNSCINQVLNLRLGIPLTLALVYLEVKLLYCIKRCEYYKQYRICLKTTYIQ